MARFLGIIHLEVEAESEEEAQNIVLHAASVLEDVGNDTGFDVSEWAVTRDA